MTTPEEWRRRAAEYDARARAAAEKGDAEEALVMARAAQTAEMVAEKLEEQRQQGSHSDTLKGMLPAARVRISKGAKRGRQPDELQIVGSAAGHTLRSIAEALGCSNVFLLKARRGDKAIRESWAKSIQEMTRSKEHPTGFAATRRNWPGGWAREPSG